MDYANYEYVREMVAIVNRCFDYEKLKWIVMPFPVGILEQEDYNPKLWQMINYIIIKTQEVINGSH